MRDHRTLLGLLTAITLLVGLWLSAGARAADVLFGGGEKKEGKDKKDDKKEPAVRKGTVVGTVTAKGKGYIEVKADGEEKARRYVPHWVGGPPDKGGGLDKKMLKVFDELKIGARIRLEWEWEERARAVRIEILQQPGEKK
jgi:hypothetical protein